MKRRLKVTKIFEKKSHNGEKTERGDSLVSPGIVLRGKKEKSFWFTSLGQMVQFDTIKFRRNFKTYFGQFVWMEKNQ